MIKNVSSVPVEDAVDDVSVDDLLNEVDGDLDLDASIDLLDSDYDDDESYDGLGAISRKHKRSKSRRRGRKSRARRHGHKKTKAQLRRSASRRAKSMPRTAKGRFIKMSGLGKTHRKRKSSKSRKHRGRRKGRKTHAMHGLDGISNFADISSMSNDGEFGFEDGLGAVKHKRRKKGRAKHRRRGRGHKRSRMHGLGYLSDAAAALSDGEVAASMPVLGVFQWIGSRGGLEALGGVALGPVVAGLVKNGLGVKLLGLDMSNVLYDVAGSLVSAVALWELGKLIGSGHVAKYGAMYILGSLIERRVVKPWVMDKIGMSDLSNVLFPNLKRSDYAVNPLSDLGQARIYENQDLVGLGTVRLPDEQGLGTMRVADEQREIGTVRLPDDQAMGDEDGVGQFDEELSEDSEVF